MSDHDIELLIGNFCIKNKIQIGKSYSEILEYIFDLITRDYSYVFEQDVFDFCYRNKKLLYYLNLEDKKKILENESKLFSAYYSNINSYLAEQTSLFFNSLCNICELFENSEEMYFEICDFLLTFYKMISYKEYLEIDYVWMKLLLEGLEEIINDVE